jgi:hypothetical protein
MIRINININNDPSILEAIKKFLKETAPQWVVNKNTSQNNNNWETYKNKTAKYFIFDLENCYFSWGTVDDDSSISDECYQEVNSIEQALSFAEFAIQNAISFKVCTIPSIYEPYKYHYKNFYQDTIPNEYIFADKFIKFMRTIKDYNYLSTKLSQML